MVSRGHSVNALAHDCDFAGTKGLGYKAANSPAFTETRFPVVVKPAGQQFHDEAVKAPFAVWGETEIRQEILTLHAPCVCPPL